MRKNSLFFLFILGVLFTTSGFYYAESQNYQSNGQTSFYGHYEQQAPPVIDEDHQLTNSETKQQSTEPVSTTQNKVRAILPIAGDYLNPIYQQLGCVVLVFASFMLVRLKRRGVEANEKNL
ncbi:hypothetical protein [Vagococcus zengguangii]|uniref:Uncharacterized protein n=1 Tax=Vagococcus zengguangii TaxID=2571750 RepID=A0A4D7CR39_9ENTE|nr:hypothetical protein [Vagococcus zengguangii]QCI85463.1 hypothetical protein FA707_00105 [Vagococcus zengguangii]TLG80008.1 hypothetical protein FE258_06660 [Vagococcus zengguangii]